MQVQQVSKLTGVSIRTLHHYDKIGLLKADDYTEAGYRMYSNDNIATLQQILFFKELGFSLKKIKSLLESPTYDQLEAFQYQREKLLEKKEQLTKMIETIDRTIQMEKGEITMTNEERFEGFNFSENHYEKEAIDKWGKKAVDEANQVVAEKGDGLGEEMNAIYRQLATLRHLSPSSEEAQEAIHEWYVFLNKLGNYSLEAFVGLGQMYVMDERFTNNIDQFGEGLAQFMCEAMGVYGQQR